MFGSEFYPTPKNLIREMLSPYTTGRRVTSKMATGEKYSEEYYTRFKKPYTILEPQAGKGDICDFITELDKNADVYCIELNKELQYILQQKKYRVIHDDFLTYSGKYYFDLIVMNPPFSNGDKHLLKAWEMLEEGDIACILNAETYRNQYTESRKLLGKIIDDHGTINFFKDTFADAERSTDVEIAIVHLTKKAEANRFKFDFKNVTKQTAFKLDENTFFNPLATRDVIGNMIIQFDKLRESFIEFMQYRQKMNFYAKGIYDQPGTESIWALITGLDYSNGNGPAYNQFSDRVKRDMWLEVLSKTQVEKYMTHKVRENFKQYQNAQGYMDFTKENIAQLIQFVFENRYNIMDEAIGQVFDLFSKYHKDNCCHVEGWKTNDKWKVNRKIILPYGVSYGGYMTAQSLKDYGDRFSSNSNKWSEYSDIDKVMCYLTGTSYEECDTIYGAMSRTFEKVGTVRTGDEFKATGESQFFNFRFFKKGTLHIEFKDEKLWQEFNLRACAGKNWLPDDEKASYEKDRRKRQENAKEQAFAVNSQLLLADTRPVIMEERINEIVAEAQERFPETLEKLEDKPRRRSKPVTEQQPTLF